MTRLIKSAIARWAKHWVIRWFASEPIRTYLDGTMSPQQIEAFELAMLDDPQLADMMDAERLLRIGLREIAARTAAAATQPGSPSDSAEKAD